MRKLVLFTLISIAFLGKGRAQVYKAEDDPLFSLYKNSVYVEAPGHVFWFPPEPLCPSVNYERLLPLRSFTRQTIAIRAGAARFIQDNNVFAVCPLEVSTFWGHHFVKPEFGLGFTFYNRFSEKQTIETGGIPVTWLGMRMQKQGSHFFGKIGFAIYILDTNYADPFMPMILPFPGLSLGYSFGKRNNS